MKSILVGNKKTVDDSKYPYLGIWDRDGIVVLFSAPRTGTVVHKVCSVFNVGYHATDWGEDDSFEPLRGKIVLHN